MQPIQTSAVLWVTYPPPRVPSDVRERHVPLIEEHARLISRLAVTEQRRWLVA